MMCDLSHVLKNHIMANLAKNVAVGILMVKITYK